MLSCGEGGLLATDDDEVAATARSPALARDDLRHLDRHRGHQLGYDVVGLGFNYRLDEPRAALLISRLAGLEEDIARRRALVHRYRRLLAGVAGVTVPTSDDEVDTSSCYVMPLLLEDLELRGPLRELMRERWKVQTSLLYPVDPRVQRVLGVAGPCPAGGADRPHTKSRSRSIPTSGSPTRTAWSPSWLKASLRCASASRRCGRRRSGLFQRDLLTSPGCRPGAGEVCTSAAPGTPGVWLDPLDLDPVLLSETHERPRPTADVQPPPRGVRAAPRAP